MEVLLHREPAQLFFFKMERSLWSSGHSVDLEAENNPSQNRQGELLSHHHLRGEHVS